MRRDLAKPMSTDFGEAERRPYRDKRESPHKNTPFPKIRSQNCEFLFTQRNIYVTMYTVLYFPTVY